MAEYVRDNPKTCFCALSCDKVYRPFSSGGQTINGIIYHDMLELWLMPLLLDNKHSFPTWQSTTYPQGGKNILEEAVGWVMVQLWGIHFLVSTISRPDPDSIPRHSVKGEVYVLPMPVTLNNLKDRILTPTAKTEQPSLQNIWHKVEYCLYACWATKGEHTAPARVGKNFLSCPL
jgi:hypothetical protein